MNRTLRKIVNDRLRQPEVRWWLGVDDDPAKQEQIVVSAADAQKKPPHGDLRVFTVLDTLTGKHVRLRRADCGLGCQCAIERVPWKRKVRP